MSTDVTTEAPESTDVTSIAGDGSGTDAFVEEELLVEEISIDGMCGVY
ncbi:MAG TPA: mycofactocin precursor MftA [Acidimicrobiales bacterium]